MDSKHKSAIEIIADKPTKVVPGEAGIWVLVFVDLCLFTVFFLNYLNDRHQNYIEFAAAQTQVNEVYGLLNTIVLLFSSWLVVVGVQSVRNQRHRLAAYLFAGAAVMGVVFLVIKLIEYQEKFAVGILPNTHPFFDHYFFLTGLHFVHVVIGVGLLLLMSQYNRFDAPIESKINNLICGASFWHLVDLLWIALLGLLYLLP